MNGEPVPYTRFRTGLTYKDVYHMIYTRKYKRRRGVLGFWHELKQKMYADYLRGIRSPTTSYVPNSDPIPE